MRVLLGKVDIGRNLRIMDPTRIYRDHVLKVKPRNFKCRSLGKIIVDGHLCYGHSFMWFGMSEIHLVQPTEPIRYIYGVILN